MNRVCILVRIQLADQSVFLELLISMRFDLHAAAAAQKKKPMKEIFQMNS
jgi:hypothetical protein